MPTYEYKCRECGHVFEVTQKITAPPLQDCPKCKKGHVERQLNPSAFILKGKGWYVTDYARKDGGGEAARNRDREEKSAPPAAVGTEKKETQEAKGAKETPEAKVTKETPKDSAAGSLKQASNS